MANPIEEFRFGENQVIVRRMVILSLALCRKHVSKICEVNIGQQDLTKNSKSHKLYHNEI